MKRLLVVVIMLSAFIFTLSINVQPTEAAVLGGGFTATPTCTDFTATVGTVTWDRDNTGTGNEEYYYHVFDGAGTVVAYYGPYTGAVGSSGSYGGATLAYNVATPAYNPLTVQWVSVAGNGFPQQIFYENQANCATLPFLTVQTMNVPHVDDLRIDAWAPLTPYDSPNGEPVRLADGSHFMLPQDYDGNGFDTYVVTDIVVIDGETWYSIFLGNEDFAWVNP